MNTAATQAIKVFSTSPQSSAVPRSDYIQRVIDVARWSEQYGCEGILVYTDNSLVDPWLVAQIILENTTKLGPLVAVQPVYMHPYSVAKMVSSLGHLYGRRVYLNMVAGGFKNDLIALNDTTPHDKRYARLIEYTTIINRLLTSTAPVTFEGEFYIVRDLKLQPALPPQLLPEIFVSGSSDSGLEAARAMGAIAVQYPKPPSECAEVHIPEGLECGIRVGVIARANSEESWAVAHQRFPEDRKGTLTHQFAMNTSDSVWHRQLSETANSIRDNNGPYWLLPFETYKTFCPYLVGSYAEVAAELARYVNLGFRNVILDIPPSEEELRNIQTVFRYVTSEVNA